MFAIKIAILDMYAGVANEGMRCIRQLIDRTQLSLGQKFIVEVFDVRGANQVPDLSHDIYISTGGPGSPLPSEGAWEEPYFRLLDQLFAWNHAPARKKYLLLICHSFQLASRHLGVGKLSKRKSTSFGVLPIHKTAAGLTEPLLVGLPEPFFAVDSRDYQVTHPDFVRLEEIGAEIVCLEKARPHVPLARALMGVRFTSEVFGTQFHPEADGDGMLRYMLTDERRRQVIATYGEAKYTEMVAMLRDPTTIEHTESVILPEFLRRAVEQIQLAATVPAPFDLTLAAQ